MSIVVNHPFRTDLDDNYTFVNNIRHWSMVSVIFLHSAGCASLFGPVVPTVVYILIELGKFGTIGFFVISGFLLSERFAPTRRLNYVRRRLERVAAPWALWFCVFWMLKIVRDVKVNHRALAAIDFHYVVQTVVNALFLSAYWFVPSLLLSLCVLLAFYRRINDWRFGAAAFAVSLFYGVNVYGHWWPTQHSYAFLGFLSYLWLGAWAAKNRKTVTEFVAKVPVVILALVSISLMTVSYFETRMLLALQNPDAVNTLRISNQLFSLSVILLFLKMPNVVWPRFVNVREHTFGLYLVHAPIVGILVRVIKGISILNQPWFQSGAGIICLVLILFVCTYTISGAITILLARHASLCWMVGARPAAKKELSPEPAAQPILELAEVE